MKAEKIVYVDAFTNRIFGGNPAAVVFLTQHREPRWMQSIAAETGLSETAFVLPSKEKNYFHIWWFTPTTEAPLCGHATLAAAHVLWQAHDETEEAAFTFMSFSGPLIAKKKDEWIELDFPSEQAKRLTNIPALFRKNLPNTLPLRVKTGWIIWSN